MDFKAISSVVAEDFEAVNRFITHHLDTEVPLIREVGSTSSTPAANVCARWWGC